jgi:hypothetical protein
MMKIEKFRPELEVNFSLKPNEVFLTNAISKSV